MLHHSYLSKRLSRDTKRALRDLSPQQGPTTQTYRKAIERLNRDFKVHYGYVNVVSQDYINFSIIHLI